MTIMQEINIILSHSRNVAIDRKLYYIDASCILLGLLETENSISGFLDNIDKEKVKREVEALFSNAYLGEEVEEVPLTAIGEMIVHAAREYQELNNAEELNGVYMLLGILTFVNEASKVLLKEGVLFKDVNQYCLNHNLTLVEVAKARVKYKDIQRWRVLLAKWIPFGSFAKQIQDKLYHQSHFYFDQREYASAIQSLDDLSSFKQIGYRYGAYLLLGVIYADMKNHKLALDYYDKAIALNLPDFTAYLNKGLLLSDMKEYEQSMKVYKQALEVEPESPIIYNNMGFCRMNLEQYEEAKKDFDKAIKLDINFAYPYNNCGFAYYKLGDLDKALELINHSLKLDEGNSFAYKNKALVYITQSKIQEACHELDLAEKYGFEEKHGDKVKKLKEQYCNK